MQNKFQKILLVHKFNHLKTEIDKYIIKRVLTLRKQQKLSQSSLSFMINVSKSFIANVENPNSRAKYNIQHINELCKALNCTFSDLFPPQPL